MSSVTVTVAPDRQARRARAAVAALFLTNGALFSNVVPRYPQIKADLGVSNTVLGTALAAFPLGALLAGLFAAAAIRRFRSSRVAVVGIVLLAATTVAIPFAPNWVALARSTPSSTWPRTRTACACSASTAARSSTRSTVCGASAPCSAA